MLENHGSRIGAEVTALLDTRLNLRSLSASGGARDFQAAVRQVAPLLASQPQGSRMAVIGGVPYQFVMVPMRAPVVIGWVLMGFPVSQPLADEMRQLLSVHVALLVKGEDGVLSVPVSTLPAAPLAMLRRQGIPTGELDTDQGVLLARASPLDTVGGEVQALLLRSVDEVVAPYRQLQVLLAIITVAGVLLFALGNGVMAQRVTTPLRSLLAATRRLSRGEYDVPMEHTDRADEIGNLARSFDKMRVDIGAQQSEIRRLAFWDRLTGLPNRERFRAAVVAATSANVGVPQALAVLTLDLDRFKHVNDVLGYAFGDRLLQAVAGRLREQVGAPQDMVARMGGNEFAVLLQGADAAAAHEVARRIHRSFEEPLVFEDQSVDLSAGIGIACWPDDADDADTLLSRSEIAMYAAKRQLSGALRYDPGFDLASAQTLSLLSELRRAVEHNELRLYLQPKVALHGQPGLAAEALVRWQHPQRGQIAPDVFVPIAEESGLILALSNWVLEQACRNAANWPVQLFVSVNLSPSEFKRGNLIERIQHVLSASNIDPARLELEITEGVMLDDAAGALEIMRTLKRLGVRIALDDFGTGYSSLSYLRAFPFDGLKIDRSFLSRLDQSDSNNESDQAIIQAIVGLGRALSLTVTAEGVETADHLKLLQAVACDEGQGYYLSRPLGSDAFRALSAIAGGVDA